MTRAARLFRWVAVVTAAVALPRVLLNSHVWPLGVVVAGDVGGDYGMFTWNFWQMTEAVTHARNPFWAPAIYHPVGAHLARHTYGFGFVPIGLLAKALTFGSPLYPIYAYRAAIWTAFALGVVLGWAALCRLGASQGAALWAACAHAFSAFFLAHIPHTNLLAGAFVLPAVTLAAQGVWRRPASLWSWASLGAVGGASVYFSEFGVFAAMGLVAVVIVAAVPAATRRDLVARLAPNVARGAGAAIVCAVVVTAPFLASWAQDDAEAPRAVASFRSSADLLGFLVPNGAHQPLYAPWTSPDSRSGTGIDGRETFVGFPLAIMALAALVQRGSRWRWVAFVAGVVFLVLSLGPELHVGGPGVGLPLPYAWLMSIPPLNMARAPVRLVAIAVWLLACVASVGLTQLEERLRGFGGRWASVALVGAVLTWSLAEGYRDGPRVARFDPPAALAGLPPGPVINVPLSFMDGHAMFLQVFHGRPIVTGFLARRGVAQGELVRRWDAVTERGMEAFAAELGREGIHTVIADPGTNRAWLGPLRAAGVTVVDLRTLE